MKMFRLNAGTDLLATVERACADAESKEAWVRASGKLTSVHLIGPNDENIVVRTEPSVLASFDASYDESGFAATAVVAFSASGVPVVLAGRVKSAVAESVSVALYNEGAHAVASVASVVADDISAKPPAPAPEPANPWAQVAAVSAAVSDEDDEEEVDIDDLSRGDVLMHPTLGRCKMVGAINDSAIKVRLPNGSTRKLMMRVFTIRRRGTNEFELVKA